MVKLIDVRCPHCDNDNLDKMTLLDTGDVDEDLFFWVLMCNRCGEYFESPTIYRRKDSEIKHKE